ncbi:nicotinate (nicotinamide) nucleotide adenylyltransferase [Patescibacteria group bacterium]|nr:nicotinate (nicotinamide) nucleotide adenylyltransferase [Patescibacteria group bacterium]
MHIALFGGAFNPPHLGHIMIARQVLDFTDTDEVWFLPNYGQDPPKPDLASVGDRLAMVKLIESLGTRVSTLEIDHMLDGNTINLLPFLPKEHSYTFIIGSDWLPSFHLWGNWEELLRKLPFYVFPRNGYPNEPLCPNMTVVSHPNLIVTDISATKIRERIKAGLSVAEFVPEAVADYMRSHRLYQ